MELPKKVRVDYIKNAAYRTIHADGGNGGLTPELNIFLAFWLQRGPLPETTLHDVTPDGRFAGIPSETVQKASIVREIETGVVMTVEVAKQIHEWLGQRIRDVEEVQSASRNEIATQ